MSITAVLMLITTIVTFLVIAAAMLVGFFRGWKKCLLGLCRTVAAALLAFFVVLIFCLALPAGAIFKNFVEPITGELEIVSDSAAIQTLSGTFVYTLIMPFFYSMLFVAFDLLLLIPAYFIGRALGITGKKKEEEKKGEESGAEEEAIEENSEAVSDDAPNNDEAPETNNTHMEAAKDEKPDETPEKDPETVKREKRNKLIDRFGGAGIRCVTALIIITISLLPFAALLYTFTDGFVKLTDTARTQNITVHIGDSDSDILGYKVTDGNGDLDIDEVDRACDDILNPLRNNIFLRLAYCAPMRALCNGMTLTKDSSGSARNEITQLFDVFSDSLYFMADFEDYGEAQKGAVTRIIGYVSDSELHSTIVADVISGVAQDALDNNKALGSDISELKKGDSAVLVNPLLDILSETTKETVREDFNTVRDILIAMIDYRIPYELAVTIVTEEKTNLINSLSNEEFLYSIISSLYNNDDFRELTAPMINYVFNIVIKQFDKDAQTVEIASSESKYTDDQLREEAHTISLIFKDAGKVMESAPALLESKDALSAIAAADMATMGRFLNNARKSIFIGEGVDTLIITILETSAFDSMRNISDILIKHVRNDKDLNMENLLTAVQQFASIVQKYDKNGSQNSMNLAEALRNLSRSCDPKTAVILKEIINDSSALDAAMLSTGDSARNQSAKKVLSVFVDKLTSGELTDEEYENEAKAVDYAMKLVNANSSEDLEAIYGGADGRREMVQTLSGSKIASAALIEIAYVDGDPTKPLTTDGLKLKSSVKPEDVGKMRDECKTHYIEEVKNGADKETLAINIKAIAAVFDETITDADISAWNVEAGV